MNRLSGQPRIAVLSLLDRPEGNVGVELGVAAGGFSRQLLDSGRFRLLYGVDAYADHHDIDEYKTALRRLGPPANYALLRMRFDQALDLFDDGSLDFVYIDGYAHTGQEGGETIYAWASKVRLGGVLAGHDYAPDFPLTVQAVDRFGADAGFDVYVADGDADFPSWALVKTAAKPVRTPPPELGRAGRRATRIAALRRLVPRPVKRLLKRAKSAAG